MESELTTGATVELTLDAMAHGGEAIGSLPDGRRVFVARGIPGETVRARITKLKKRWGRAELLDVVEPSADRVEARCPHATDCGGCQWQHIGIERQRALKREIVAGQLAHLGGFEDTTVEETDGAGNAEGFGYRNHVLLRFDRDGRPAYYRGGTHDLVPVSTCPILHPLLGEWLERLPALPGAQTLELRAGVASGERLAMLRGEIEAAAEGEASAQGISLRPPGRGEIHESIAGEDYRISSKSFFQVNSAAAERLVELVLAWGEPRADAVALDLYAGVGLFALPLARRGAKVHAVESHPAALRDLRRHAKGHSIHVVGRPVEEASEQLPRRADLVVADPPRAGLSEPVVAEIVAREPRCVLLVSCDPAALARDAKAFRERGYRLDRVRPLDMFPQTYHVETLARLLPANVNEA